MFSSTDLVKASGLSFRRIDRWAREGDLVPSVREGARGINNARVYSEQDLRAAVVIGRIEWPGGVPRFIVREVVQAVRDGVQRLSVALGPAACLVIEVGPDEAAA